MPVVDDCPGPDAAGIVKPNKTFIDKKAAFNALDGYCCVVFLVVLYQLANPMTLDLIRRIGRLNYARGFEQHEKRDKQALLVFAAHQPFG